MANPTTKFVSVNLNKSYGQQQSNRPSSSPSPYHGGIASRANRPGGSSGGSAGGGGMVVLSRPRSSVSSGPKSGARLSVPSPLNLPSLRKEHERFDPSAVSGSLSGASSAGLGMGRGGSAVMGWNKPSTAVLGLQDKDGLPRDLPGRPGSGDQRVGSPGGSYIPSKSGMPPLAAALSNPAMSAVQRAVLLKGEDFPSLQASIISNQKQKDASGLKQKQQGDDELYDGQVDKATAFASSIPMRPQMRSSHSDSYKELNVDGGPNRTSGRSSTDRSSHKLDDILPGPLPMVQLRHTSDWADDERDTGLSIPDRSKERSFLRNEASRNYDYYDERGLHDSELVGAPRKEFSKADSFGRDTLVSDRNANSWRPSMHPKDGFAARESDGSLARVSSHSKDSFKDGSKYGQYPNGGRDGSRYDGSEVQQNRMDFSGHGQNFRTSRNGMDAYNRRSSEQNLPGRPADAPNSRLRGGSLQNNSFSSASVSSGGKGFPLDDPIFNFRRFPTSSRKLYLDGADDQDTLTSGILGDASLKTYKKKKDVPAQVELNDPVRESFEAELERVQRMQEEERQRVLQEHARVLEVARKEEEERQRLAREEEEKRRQLEQEARDAAWRAEQEKLEAARQAEEKRIAREDEKKRILLEEERRKEAARQKLLELEARIAKRQAEEADKSNKPPAADDGNDQMPSEVKQQDAQKFADSGEWEDGERMVEQITSSTLSDAPSSNRLYLHGSSISSSANGYKSSKESGNQSTYWKNETDDNASNSAMFAEQANGHPAPRRDAFNSGRVITRKDFYSNSGGAPARPSSKGGTSEAPHSFVDEYYPNLRGQRWNVPGDGDRFLQNNSAEPDLLENDKFSEIGWERNRPSDGSVTLYGDSLFQNSGGEGFSSSRSRYFLRQPRVLPPPSLSSISKNTFKMNSPRSNENRHENTEKLDEETFESRYLKSTEQHPAVSMTQENAPLAAPIEKNSSSLSQSSASLSSPPSSPDNVYHEELDNSGDLPVLPESADEKGTASSDDDCVIDAAESGKTNNEVASRALASREEDEWTVENNDVVHTQDEYDEEHDYQEEVDVHEDEDGIDIVQELYLRSDIQNVNADVEQDQQVLGFNEGTEVRITSSDEFEIETDNDEKDIEAQVISSVARQEAASADGFVNSEDNLQSGASFLDGSQENYEILKTTEKAMQDVVLEPVASTTSSISHDITSQPISTSAYHISCLPSPLGQPILSSASSVHSQTENPMQLQFGLFSGPSLIPSPVPAIQIGSIQMPLSLHHPVRPFPHIHPSQPPFFQFGQLQYTSPLSQGILPINPQNMPFLQNSVSAQYSLAQNSGNPLQKHVIPQFSDMNPQKELGGSSVQYKNGVVGSSSELSGNKFQLNEYNAAEGKFLSNSLPSSGQMDISSHPKELVNSQTTSQAYATGGHDDSLRRSGGLMSNNGEQHRENPDAAASQSVSAERSGPELRPPGSSSSGRGKRYIYAIKNSSLRSQLPESEASRADNNVFQRRIRRNTRRTEFRVRASQNDCLDSFNPRIQDAKHQFHGDASVFHSRVSSRKEISSNRSSKSMAESEKSSTDAILSEAISSGAMMSGKDIMTKTLTSPNTYPYQSDGNLHRIECEEDVDAPMLTGVVRVYKQPGIETPSDEDNFIEVRSKRQMLNDRREQREKEIKAKSRTLKAQQRARSLNHGMVPSKAVHREGHKSVPRSVIADGSSTTKDLLSSSVKMGSQTPISNGHQAGSLDSDSGSIHTNSLQTSSSGGSSLGAIQNFPEVVFENTAFTNVTTRRATTVTSSDRHLNQQVMTLTQTQLDEAMEPEYTRGAFRDNHSDAIDSTKSSTSANPVTSLLAGEKIQFGAVTTPTYLPPVNRAIHNSLGGPHTSCKSDPIERKSASRNDAVYFNKEKHREQSCVHLEDPESEAEAAASAVAVAAISSDDVSNDTAKENIQEAKNLSSGEESLIVSLPADLSVENPPSLWPILPSPQSSSNPMLSHFPGASPSHFPFFDMNPMLRGPMFTFGAQDDSVSTQSQTQKSGSLSSGPLGAWPPCPSGLDSVYGHPAGFAGPFLNPAAGMPGVQPPHPMVFYNHFSPLAQFGVSFMGGPFIPSGKQPEWRHNHLTSIGVSEPSISTQDACSVQNNPPNIAASMQHLTPGSLMSVASPLPLFEMPPFQQPVDLPVPAQWPNMTPPVHTVPLSPLSHHRLDSGIHAQVNHALSLNPSSGANNASRCLDSQPSVSADAKYVFPANSAAQFPNELGLVEPSNSDGLRGLNNRPLYSSLRRNLEGENNPKNSSSSNSHIPEEVISSVSAAASCSTQNTKCATKPQTVIHSVSPPLPRTNIPGHGDKRAGPSQKVVSGGDWHRRSGFQGRKPTQGSEKNFTASKMKQIYVAKSPLNGATATG